MNQSTPLSRSLFTLGAALTTFAALTGCSSGPSAPQPAKNLYVLNYSSSNNVESDTVLAFATTSTGTATPSATLNLPTNFDAWAVATGPDGEIYVAGEQEPNSTAGEILVYPAGSTGTATPSATLTGSATPNNGNFTYADYITVNSKGTLFVVSDDYTVESFAAGATSATSPAQYITWGVQQNSNSQTNFSDVYSIAADSTGTLYVMDYGNSTVDVFAAGATGTTAPTRTITGTASAPFSEVYEIAIDPSDNLYVANLNQADLPSEPVVQRNTLPSARHLPAHLVHSLTRAYPRSGPPALETSIIVFAPGASGTPTPTRTLAGASTGIIYPAALAVDNAANLYYMDYYAYGYQSGTTPLMVFPATATGNVAPTRTFTSTALTDPEFGTIADF
jgi:hypothetical protein